MEMKNFLREMKASLADEAVSFGVLVIVLVVVAAIITTIQGTQTSGTQAYNASVAGGNGIAQFTSWLSIIAIVIVAGFLIRMVRSGGLSGGAGSYM